MSPLLRGFAAPRAPQPGAALLHPVTLLALGTLIVNDHLLKSRWPGVLSGKLSDFAGVVLLPLFLHGLLELLCARLRRPLRAPASERLLLTCIALSALTFALPEVWAPAELAYRYGLGALRYPFQLAWSFAGRHATPPLNPVRATADVSDLLALPMTLLAWRVGRCRPASALPQASAVSHST